MSTKPPAPETFMFADDGSVPNNARLPLSRIQPAGKAMPLAIAPNGSAPASAPTRVGDTPKWPSPNGAISAE